MTSTWRLHVGLYVVALLSGGVASAGAQGTDTTRNVSRDSAAHVTPDTTRGARLAAPAGVSLTDSGRGAPAMANHDTIVGPRTAADTALLRVRSLIAQGQTASARTLVDSLLASTPPGSLAYGSVLYTRATLATNADSAENDYRRVTVEYASSPRAADALLRLAQLELARGDREQAAAHLDRLTREQLPNQTGITYARTQLQVGLAYFDLQDQTRACAALLSARAASPSTDVELRNRIDYNIQRCPPPGLVSNPVDTAHARSAGPDSLAKTQPSRGAATASRSVSGSKAPQASTKKPVPPTSPPPANAGSRRLRAPGYTVQVAAYPTHAAAAALVDQLEKRGYVARIFGTSAPFRVRVGRFATESLADSAVRSLKAKGMTGFVTPSEVPNP
jgi:cell division septation protein DedD